MTRLEKRVRIFAACLAGLAGYVDAIGFIYTGGFFVSFMSGNSTRLGLGVAEALHDAAIAGGIILSFIAGVAGGSLVGHVAGHRRAPLVLLLIAGLLAAAAILAQAGVAPAAIGLVALAMGAENAIFERAGETRVGLTYMTGSLVKVGQGIAGAMLGRNGSEWLSYLLLWSGFVVGAIAGAAVYPAFQLESLLPASAAALLFATLSTWLLTD